MRPATYEVRIEGVMPPPMLAELNGMRLVGHDPAETVLRGVISDQSALLGLIRHVEDAGCVVRDLYVVGGAGEAS